MSIARHDPGHQARSKITERKLLPWITAEAARMHVPHRALAPGEQEGRRDALEAERARIILLFTKGTIDEARMDTMVAEVDAGLNQLEAAAEVVDIPPTIDWEASKPEDINAALRAMWRRVELGDDLMLVRAECTVLEWRVSIGLTIAPRASMSAARVCGVLGQTPIASATRSQE